MKKILALLVMSSLLGCSYSTRKQARSGQARSANKDPSTSIIKSSKDAKAELTGTSVQFLLTTDALQHRFAFFGSSYPRGKQWFDDAEACWDSYQYQYRKESVDISPATIFNPTERFGHNWHVNRFALESVNLMQNKGTRSISQEYVKALRTVVGDLCLVRIAKDESFLTKSTVTTKTPRQDCRSTIRSDKNDSFSEDGQAIVMRRLSAPSVEEVQSLMHKFFGYEAAHVGADRYAAAFADAASGWASDLGEDSDEFKEALRGGYHALCVAIGTDQRVFLR